MISDNASVTAVLSCFSIICGSLGTLFAQNNKNRKRLENKMDRLSNRLDQHMAWHLDRAKREMKR